MKCRICENTSLDPVIDLGAMPLVNRLHNTRDEALKAETFPLRAVYCAECGLVQLDTVIPWQQLYAHYPFFTGSSKRMVDHYVRQMNYHTKGLARNDLLVEIGSNDGSVLKAADRVDLKRVGIDPAENMPHYDISARLVKSAFTNDLVVNHLLPAYGKAKLIIANNVLGHVSDVHDFMEGIRALLDEDGEFVFEVPYLGCTLNLNAYDQFYHEHLSYFSMRPLARLLYDHGMYVHDESLQDVHGGSLRIVAKMGEMEGDPWMCESEHGEFVARIRAFEANCKRDAIAFMEKLVRTYQSGRLVGYGASAKCAVILNACEITHETIPLVVDTTPAKLGKCIPGTGQLIVTEEAARLNDAAGIVLFAWNHAEEIRANHPHFKDNWIHPHGGAR